MKSSYKKMFAPIQKKLVKDYGKRCKVANWDCAVCRVYILIDLMNNVIETDEYGNEFEKKRGKIKIGK